MKRLLILSATLLFVVSVFSQVPQRISYQAVIRNSSGELIKNWQVGMRISILQGSETGTPVYIETHTTTTNSNGLVTIEIGGGTPVSGTFADIVWSTGTYFLKTETDPAGGVNYTSIVGISQVLSVPYAMYAKNAASYSETDPVFSASPSNGISGSNISNWNTTYGWGNHAGLYRPVAWVPSWTDVTGKPSFATVATSGNYSDLTGKPAFFSGSFADLTYKPATLSGYGITDAMSISHIANSITSTQVTNWDAAYGWGNHALMGYVPGSRTLAINGTALDLSDNRSWNVGTVTSVGLSLPPIFSVSGSPVITSGTLSSTFVSQTANTIFAAPNGIAGTPVFRTLVNTDIPNLDWSKITSGKPATLTGYGIIDGVSTSGNQTIAGNKTFTGTTTVPTPVNATDAATKAYVDALLTQIQTLQSQPGVVKDVDGNLYTTIKIGTQVWMAENLKTSVYNDGTGIPLVTDETEWSNLTTPGCCWSVDGTLYNWYAVSTTSNSGKNVCPLGWHVPTNAEWTTMENYLIANGYNYDGATTGNKYAKSLAATVNWIPSITTGAVGNTDYPEKRNVTGFTALAHCYRLFDGTFGGHGAVCILWSVTGSDATSAWYFALVTDEVGVDRFYDNKKHGFSVRCIRD